MRFYKLFYIKHITYNLLPILLLICAVLFFRYSYNIEHFFIEKTLNNFRKKATKTVDEKCKDDGYKNCFHKKKEKKCKDDGYKNCDDKAKQIICKEKGYDDCDDKKNKIKSKRETDELSIIARRVEFLGNNIGNTHLNI
jgi:hypothetical protein